jgi:hypothetical protein
LPKSPAISTSRYVCAPDKDQAVLNTCAENRLEIPVVLAVLAIFALGVWFASWADSSLIGGAP